MPQKPQWTNHPFTEFIVCYAERVTEPEGNVQALEDRLNQLEIGNQQPLIR